MTTGAISRTLQQRWTHLLLVAVLGLVAYSNSFHVPFVFDDIPNIVDNGSLRDVLGRPRLSGAEHSTEELVGYQTRPIGYLTLALNYRFSGLDVTGYHAVNLAIHVSAAALLYALVVLAFRSPRLRDSNLAGSASFVALLAASLFVTHPLQTQAVTYVVQRLASLATLLSLLAFVCYLAARLSSGAQRLAFQLGAVLAMALAMGTKEISFTVPPTIALFDLLFFSGRARERAVHLVPLLATMAIIPVALLGVPTAGGLDLAGKTNLSSDLSRAEYLFTELTVIVRYIRLLLLPVGQNLDYDYPIHTSLWELPVLASLALLLALVGAALRLVLRTRRGDPALRLVGFGILWFFVALSVESSLVPIVDVIFEHRVYLPSAGAFLACATGFVLGLRSLPPRAAPAMLALGVAIPLTLVAVTHARNEVWSDEVSLWKDVVAKSPKKGRGYLSLGKAYFDLGQYDQAIATWQTILELGSPARGDALLNIGNAHLALGDMAAAAESWKQAVELNPSHSEALNQLGSWCLVEGRHEEAIHYYRQAIAADRDNAEAHFNLARLLEARGDMEGAAAEYAAFIEVAPPYLVDQMSQTGVGSDVLRPRE